MSIYKEPIEWLEQSINSILNQTYKNIEFIIIIDNPDHQQAISLVKHLQEKDHRIKFEVNPENKGLIFSLNRGLKLITGDFIARMDADDISVETRFEKQLNYLLEKNLDFIGSDMIRFSDNNSITPFLIEYPKSDYFIKKLTYDGRPGIPHNAFFAKKEVFLKLNGYSNQAIYAEDYDFIARAITSGYKLNNYPEALLWYRSNDNSITHLHTIEMQLTANAIKQGLHNYLKNGVYTLQPSIKTKKIIDFYQKIRAHSILKRNRKNFILELIKIIIIHPKQSFNIINIKYRMFLYVFIEKLINKSKKQKIKT